MAFTSSDDFKALLALPRLAPYIHECSGNDSTALDLYAWNVEVSAACMEVLAYLEVMLRNAVDRELSVYAEESKRKLPWFLCPSITGEATEAIARSIEATRTRLRNISPARDSRDQIVAGQTFGFWSELFGGKHEELWRAALSKALPGTPSGRRKNVTAKLERLRPFRNRLAHHDSLLAQDILFHLDEMLALAEWISPAARAWLEERERVTAVYRRRPVMPVDTLVVPAQSAWGLYEKCFAYICPPARNFRPATYLAFYADKEIKPAVPRILYHRDNVEWTAAEAARLAGLQGDSYRNDRKISASQSLGPWTDGRYQVFMLSRNGDSSHIQLKAGIPHRQVGRGSAFVQRHRYLSHHSLQSASDTGQLK
ncbi:hypothetical protein ABZ942_03170 [Nocardia sp. NPDC046473]|uniref:hypothetical protein n=1 Tax=Nocardia sp. NPDC046473 TaxID=3155733 RepID=UPI0033FC5284